jgi:DNA-binding CsgD family transcriptional regulator
MSTARSTRARVIGTTREEQRLVRPATPRVSAEIVRGALQAMDQCGFDPTPFAALVGDPRELTAPAAMVPWQTLVELTEAFTRTHGQAQTNRVARALTSTLPSLRTLANLMLPPRLLFRVLLEAVGRSPLWSLKVETGAGAASLVVSLELVRGLTPSLPVLEAVVGMLGMVPTLSELPELALASTVTASEATVRFELPRGRRFHLRPSESQLATVVEQLAPGTEPVAAPSMVMLEQRYGLTRAESRIVRRLAAGRSLTEIAEELGVGTETVRTHTKRAMQKTNTHRQAEMVALMLRPGAAS